MWKCVSKSLKTILEKNRYKCCNVPATKVTQNCKPNCFTPIFTERLNRYYDFFKSCCGEESSKDKHRKDRKAKKGFPFLCIQNKWIEALSLSIIVGWYCILPNKRIFCPVDLNNHKSTKYFENTDNYFNNKLWNILNNFAIPSPIYNVLPQVGAVKEKKSDLETESHPGKVSPEILEEAHDKVLGSLDNWLGTECMQKGEHEKAVRHFTDAAEVNNAAAFFNLGICHEMGFGTDQSFKKAAEMYKKASDLGHATAMYNLGVFYVHGWGGLEPDVDTARNLFKSAAKLGQADARKLLRMNDVPPADITNDSEISEPSTSYAGSENSLAQALDVPPKPEFKDDSLHRKFIKEVDPKVTDPTFLWYHVLNITMEDIQVEKYFAKKSDKIGSVDSGVLDLSSGDELDIFV